MPLMRSALTTLPCGIVNSQIMSLNSIGRDWKQVASSKAIKSDEVAVSAKELASFQVGAERSFRSPSDIDIVTLPGVK